jgi:hypothetical protein
MCCNTFLPFAPIDENFAGIEIHIADLDVDELAHAYRRIEEQCEQDLVLHVAAVLDGSAVAWGHLNLLGEYDFSEDKLQDSVGIKPPKLTD